MNTSVKDLPKFYLSLVNALPDPVFAIDMEGKVQIWNNAIEEMTGFRAHKMINKGDYEYALPFYRTRRPVLLDLCVQPHLDIALNYNYIQKDSVSMVAETTVSDLGGRQAHLLLQASPLYQGNRIIGAIEVIHEIAERDRAGTYSQEGFIKLKEHYALLERKNIALAQVLELFNSEKQNVKKLFALKVQKDLTNLLSDLRSKLCALDKTKLDIIEQYIKEVGGSLDYLHNSSLCALSPREAQIAQHIKEGLSNKEIAGILSISRRSVETHRMRIRKKLGVSNSSTKSLVSFLQVR